MGEVRRKLNGKSWTKPRRELKFKLGDQARISKSRRTFKKGYLPSRTQEIFTVTKIIPRVPPVYRLRDYANDEIEGVFYAKELQKVHKLDDIYKIEKILGEKKENGKVKVLVKNGLGWLSGNHGNLESTKKIGIGGKSGIHGKNDFKTSVFS